MRISDWSSDVCSSDLGGSDGISHLAGVVAALRMRDDDATGVLRTERGDVLRQEALMDGAVALPQQERGVLDVGVLEATELLARVPDPHVGVDVVAHRAAGVAAEGLVGEAQPLVAACRAGTP